MISFLMFMIPRMESMDSLPLGLLVPRVMERTPLEIQGEWLVRGVAVFIFGSTQRSQKLEQDGARFLVIVTICYCHSIWDVKLMIASLFLLLYALLFWRIAMIFIKLKMGMDGSSSFLSHSCLVYFRRWAWDTTQSSMGIWPATNGPSIGRKLKENCP